MSLAEDKSIATYQINAYSPGKITINNAVFMQSLIISADKLWTSWRPRSVADLNDLDWEPFLTLPIEIILLGTGEKSMILRANQMQPLLQKQFHVECMSTSAACRTYTALIAENRRVAAGLII
ncbi:MAG: hypothetical protein ACD_60C00085G0002 [uncultured bacterium]|nr:MAG: hypothetical protein ACD_60C00085G0002 [uncultured bacterium]OGT26752.1 MAG: hypothetical protein A3B71_03880 [Gammaproteobacteria bacterium RIFCSPHIGHO2_02_FULL_42_43]OGT29154.1 MAG: hypothetical protein A2624_01355 [Gammaproteobacteria bacterium RIFCSPHIGHO2_01_FULL_42_8]OGT52940.1 MAG: hypothetical protein A3E54_07645 [Gammaproteobacteria bacterium RIFCSPHIGHO2_12_FULL_41_25]OGT61286.1 MAG: hypothetical protein A3I77_08045 [Gammaproteobacteria bacterium RIFCSPLOWO2_02_FULL_42_14]OGT